MILFVKGKPVECKNNDEVRIAMKAQASHAQFLSKKPKSERPLLDAMLAEYNVQNGLKAAPVTKVSTQAKPPIYRAGTAKPTASTATPGIMTRRAWGNLLPAAKAEFFRTGGKLID